MMGENIEETKSKPILSNATERRVLFVDLDHTLYDSLEARKKAALRAIKMLDLKELQISDALAKYEKIVSKWKIFCLMGFPNFRLEWNLPEIYEVLLAFINNKKFQEKIDKLEEKILIIESNGTKDIEKKIENEAKSFEENKETREFRKTIKKIKNNVEIQRRIDNAVKEFESTQLIPFNDVREFLEILIQKGIEIYITTEGNIETQLEKIRKLGLTDLVNINRVIIGKDKSVEFYSRAVHIASENHPIKLAVIGDRYDKDIAPLIKLFGANVITIRALSGKYKGEFSEEELAEKKLPKPTITVNTLTEAENLLIKKSTWEYVSEINVEKIIKDKGRLK